ncbi:MAG TPA: M48 family metalloprotease [Pyrinomonadaceae bacterium]|jgi:Zn-dependent protease with chaperone function
MYALLGISIVLAALLTINALATLLAAALWRALQGRAQNWAAEMRARFLFALRLFPMIGSVACVLILLAPSYLTHEPTDTDEVVSAKLAVVAFVSAIGIALALWRGLAAWRATRLLNANWLRHAEPLKLDGISIPTYRIRHPFPVIAIVGAFKPRLFIATQVFDALDEAEMAAALAHERGHLATFDNFKRTSLRACRDALLIVPCGRSLDCAWADASEAAADEYAARGGAQVALNLASALVKIARIVPPQTKPTMPALAHLVGEDTASVARRVRRLTELASQGCVFEQHRAFSSSLALWSSLCAFLFALILTATDPTLLWVMHQAIEHMVLALS